MDVLILLIHMQVATMEIYDLIGAVAAEYLRNKIDDSANDTGFGRYMLECLNSEITTAIALAVVNNEYLNNKIDVKMPEHFIIPGALPPSVLTKHRTTYFRNAECSKEAILVADTGDDERFSLKELTPIGTTQLLTSPDIWITYANISYALNLTEDHCRWWRQCLNGLSEARSYTLERYSSFIIETCRYIKEEGEPLLEALGLALPSLQIPRDKQYFSVLNEKNAGQKKKWEELFKKALKSRACYLLKQTPNQLFLTQEQLQNAFNKCKDSIPQLIHPVIENYISSEGGWNSSAEALCKCEWEDFKYLFEGLKTEKYDLGKATLSYLEDAYPDNVNDAVVDYLTQLSKRRISAPDDDDVVFFENHRNELKDDNNLKAKWDKFIFGAAVESFDFIAGFITCLEGFFDQNAMFANSRKIIIRSNKRTKRELSTINNKAALYFCKNYKGLPQLMPRGVEWDVGELFNFEEILKDWKVQKKTKNINKSKAKSATQIKFYIDYEIAQNDLVSITKNSKQFIWKFNLETIPVEFADDINRICKYPFLKASAYRDVINGKGKVQSLDLYNIQTLHASYAQDKGSLVPKYKKDEDLELLIKQNIEICREGKLLLQDQIDIIQDCWNKFKESYNTALIDFVENGFSSEFKNQAEKYSQLLSVINNISSGDKVRRLLLMPVMQIGCAEIFGGNPTIIITPWHPLRLLAQYCKLMQTNSLIEKLLSQESVEFSDTRLFFKEMSNNLTHPYYPEVVVGWKNGEEPTLLGITDSFLGYSLHENPMAVNDGDDETNENPYQAAKLVLEIIERYLKLFPHERANLSTILYNCDSARFPQSVVSQIAEAYQDEDNLRCEIILKHRDNQKLCDLYEKIVEGDGNDNPVYVSSEASSDFMARLRIAIMADQANNLNDSDGAPSDIVFLDDVITRHAKLDWYVIDAENIDAISLKPSEWSYRRPAASDDMKSVVYLTCPVQSKEGWIYLSALSSFFLDRGSYRNSEYILPARQLDFQNAETRSIFEEVHSLGNWVANYDELLDRRQLQNQNVQVIRYKQTSNHGRNILISSKAPLGLLKTMIKHKLNYLNLFTDDIEYDKLSQRLINEANILSGDLALRAARRGRNASELIGIVLSSYIVKCEIESNDFYGWYFLDDYAEWLGQKEEQIADLMLLHLKKKDDKFCIGIIITEAKYIDYASLAAKRKESQKQLRDTVNRIRSALFDQPARMDRSLWLARLSNLIAGGIHVPSNSSNQVSDWIRAIQRGECEFYVHGYSHVFISGPTDSPSCSELSAVQNAEECLQEIYSRDDLKKMIKNYKDFSDMSSLHNEISGDVIQNTKNNFIPLSNDCNVKTKPIVEQQLKEDIEADKDFQNEKDDKINQISDENCKVELYDKDSSIWLKKTAQQCRSALQQFQLKAKLLEEKLTPNCAILKFEGSNNLTVDQVIRRQQEFLTSFGLKVTSITPEPGKVSISIARTERQILPLDNIWTKWNKDNAGNLGELLVGVREENGELLFLSPQRNAPHTLIAGDTGSGKSVLMVNLILGIASTNNPEQARIILIDPKMGVDYFPIESLPHLDNGHIIVEQDEAIVKLEWLIEEMNRRYSVLRANRVSNIFELRKKADATEKLPYLWVIHDEFAEWMMVDDYRNRVENLVGRLGVKARAAGISLIFAAQRPEQRVMPMQLRSQLGNRLILLVDSEGTSEIALGQKGAEKLLGRGHLIAKMPGEMGLVYAQVPYASSEIILKMAQNIADKHQQCSSFNLNNP